MGDNTLFLALCAFIQTAFELLLLLVIFVSTLDLVMMMMSIICSILIKAVGSHLLDIVMSQIATTCQRKPTFYLAKCKRPLSLSQLYSF